MTPWTIELGELDRKMGVEVLEQSPERVVATMPVDGNRQSLGLLHGGAMVAIAEAVGSWAAVIHASTMWPSVWTLTPPTTLRDGPGWSPPPPPPSGWAGR